MSTNTAIAILVAAMIRLVGFGPFLLVHLPITVLAASIGVWLFYVQHQFKDTSWSHDETWSFHEAAETGSSARCGELSPPVASLGPGVKEAQLARA
jgi:omega-6 fatty acid desaturase (delta-12 desaturase)